MTNCTNCNNQINENFCSTCGQPAILKRIDKHYVSHEFLHLLHFEKGFFYTAKQLTIRPGDSIREFINTDRKKHMKPIAFLILTSLLFTLVAHVFHADNIYNDKEKILLEKSSYGAIQHWIQTHYGYTNIISGFFYAISVMWFYKKYKYNFYEITVLLCFAMGQQMLLLTIVTPFYSLMGLQLYKILIILISFVYPVFIIGQFFDKEKIISYVKAFFSYLIGNILWILAVLIVALIIDLFINFFGTH